MEPDQRSWSGGTTAAKCGGGGRGGVLERALHRPPWWPIVRPGTAGRGSIGRAGRSTTGWRDAAGVGRDVRHQIVEREAALEVGAIADSATYSLARTTPQVVS